MMLTPSRAIAVAAVVTGAGVAVTPTDTATASTTHENSVTVGDFRCANGWVPPRSGQRQISVTNAGHSVVDVTLLGAHNLLIYGELEAMAPGTTRTMTAVIPPGKYRLGCTYSESATVYSHIVRVSGRPAVHDAHPYQQVTYAQLAPLVAKYRAEVSAGLATLASDTDRLQSFADAGQQQQAKQAWLVAHLDYARLGAAYDTFGDFNDEIDGRPNGLPQGVDDPELDWVPPPRICPVAGPAGSRRHESIADQLDAEVHQLVAAFPEQTTPINDLSLRAHEILENTLQFELTGESDQGSHTGLATAMANVQGTGDDPRQSLRRSSGNGSQLRLRAAPRRTLGQVTNLLDAAQLPDGTWPAVQSLSLTRAPTARWSDRQLPRDGVSCSRLRRRSNFRPRRRDP